MNCFRPGAPCSSAKAELAAGVPVVPHRDDEKHLAARLEAVLRAGAEAVDAKAAALYLLDEATTELKLRSSWGLPFDRLAAPARPLQGAVADLEALLGHAVVLNDNDAREMWRVPEGLPHGGLRARCPRPTTLLGTLWVFCDAPPRLQRPRDEYGGSCGGPGGIGPGARDAFACGS